MIAIARDACAGPGGASSTIGANTVWFSGAKPGAGALDDTRAVDADEARGCGLELGGPPALAIVAIVITIAPSAAI